MHKEPADSMNKSCYLSSGGFAVSSFNHDSVQCIRGSVVAGSDVISPPVVDNSIEGGFSSLQTIPESVLGNLNVHTSESCNRNFMIFDSTQNKNTVIFHPSLLTGCSKDSTPENAKPLINSLESFSDKVLKAMHDFHSSVSEMSKFGKKFEFINPKTGTNAIPTRGAGVKESDYIQKFKDECSFGFSRDSGEDHLSSEFHENTEEIDALLSSDDELNSTGHSPSCASSNSNRIEKEQNKSIIGKSRTFSQDEDDDADSGPAKIMPDMVIPAVEGHSRLVMPDLHPTVEGYSRLVLPDFKFSMNTMCTESQYPPKYTVDVGGGYGHSSDNLGSCCDDLDPSRKRKLRMSIQQLKDAILCQGDLDTADVLSRTIQHVKHLQERLHGMEKSNEPSMVKRMKMDALLQKRHA